MRYRREQNLLTNQPDAPQRGWADVLRLFLDVRRLAFDSSLDDADRARRIRDRFGEYDELDFGDDD